jgi:hypothetical protein
MEKQGDKKLWTRLRVTMAIMQVTKIIPLDNHEYND